jgi:signal transduction histidine kinase
VGNDAPRPYRCPVAKRPLPAQLGCDFVYTAAGVLLGTLWISVLWTLLSVAVGLIVVIVGIPMLAVTLLVWRWGANRERERAALVFGAPIADAHRPLPPTGFWKRWSVRVTDPATWKDLLYMAVVGPFVWIVLGAIVIAAWGAALAAIALPIFSSSAPAGSWLGDLTPGALLGFCAAGVAGLGIAAAITRGLSLGSGLLARVLLQPGDREALEARVAEVEATRAGAVESADARLRRIERDLHDGAQHRLAYVAMELGRAREKLGDDPEGADRLLADAHEESKKAMVELRDLARGIHPSVLTDRGLDAAVSAIAERCPVPVDIDLRLDQRPPPAVETAAYYVIAEALTNVGKHAGAHSARVRASMENGHLEVEIADDGHGGARRAPGSGLEGLAQRVEALDGTLIVSSPEGAGTTIRAELPCA